jgi:hypothetical protein
VAESGGVNSCGETRRKLPFLMSEIAQHFGAPLCARLVAQWESFTKTL